MTRLTIARDGQRLSYLGGMMYFTPAVWCDEKDIHKYQLIEEDGSASAEKPLCERC